MKRMKALFTAAAAAAAFAVPHGVPAAAEWISAPDAPVAEEVTMSDSRAADGTSWFARTFVNRGEVVSAKWTVSGLGVFEVYVNGRRVGDDFLKPGFTHWRKTKYSFSYDVSGMIDRRKGAENVLAAEVSAGWWRDKIVTPAGNKGFVGRKSAFLGTLEMTYADGSKDEVCTGTDGWRCGTAGAVRHAAIFDGEEYDARIQNPTRGEGLTLVPERNDEFKGDVLPSNGAEVALRRDLAVKRGPFRVKKGETLVVDFGQNCAAVPEFRFRAARGTTLTCLPGEMLNDAEKGVRGCDGPKGTVYRANLRCPHAGMRIVYTFAGNGTETYAPRFTFFGYRYAAITATGDVEIESVASIPVSSVRKSMETGRLETGHRDLNRFIANVYWSQLSNYLSAPTDCPQRNERLGWTADTQVFCEAGSFNADVRGFFRKWMRDMRDTQDAKGGFPGVAPVAQYGGDVAMRIGWADAGVIVPYTIWKQYGEMSIVEDNWSAMERFMARAAETEYRTENLPECRNYQWSDWLSLTRFESAPYKEEYSAFTRDAAGNRVPTAEALFYWNYLGGCYWMWDARMMEEMAVASGRAADAEKYRRMRAKAEGYMKKTYFIADGALPAVFDGMQTPALFALKLGLVEGAAKERTIAGLKASIEAGGGTLHTGFLGTSIAMDTLTANGMVRTAYDLLLNRKFPGWLYSVDQGATTVWERWNSYTKKDGFGPVSMNSFNHYAYGAVLAWMYRTMAGIAADPEAPGFRNVIMAPLPDRRIGRVDARYRSVRGVIMSSWRYEGEEWIWEFTVPDGVTATATAPGGGKPKKYSAGKHRIALKARDI